MTNRGFLMNNEDNNIKSAPPEAAGVSMPAGEPARGPMKFEKNTTYFNIALYAFLAVAAAMIFYELLERASSLPVLLASASRILQPVIIGLVLAYILNPMLRFFDDTVLPKITGKRMRRRIRRGLAILLTFLVFSLAVGAFGAVVVPQLRESLESILPQVPKFAQTVASWYSSLLEWLGGMKLLDQEQGASYFNDLIDQVLGATQSALENLYDLLRMDQSLFEQVFSSVLTATTRFAAVLLNIVVGVIISIYLLFDRERFFAQVKKLLTAVLPRRANQVLSEIALETHTIFQGFIVGKIIDSVIIGVLCYIGMLILRLEYSVLISVIVGVTNVIPYFGPFIGAIPGILILFIVEPRQALWFLIFVFLLQQFDGNILGPKILGDTIGISAFWVIFSIMLFSGIYGILGMFIGVPLFALIYSLVRRFTAFLLRRKGESVNTRDYDSESNPLLK